MQDPLHIRAVHPADDPYAVLRDRVYESVFRGPGETTPEMREAVARRENVPADLSPLVTAIHERPHTVTDADIARLRERYTDDQLFELIVSAALGASRARLAAALDALARA